jgi:thiol-disulfide isomerase/thioredoxin
VVVPIAAVVLAASVAAPPSPTSVLDLRVVRAPHDVVTVREVLGSGPAVVAFWATYCPPCRAEVPALNHAAARWRARGLRVLGLAIDSDAALVRRARTEWGIAYDVLRLAPGQDDRLEALLPRGLPATAFVSHGRVALHDRGLDDETLDRLVPALLDAAPAGS